MNFKSFRLLSLAVILIGLSGITSFGQDVKAVPDTVIVDKGIDVKFTDFAKLIELSINSKDPSVINKNFNIEVFFDRMMGGRKVSDNTKNDFIGGFSKTFAFGSQLVAGPVTLKLLRIEKNGGEIRALYRGLDPSSALMYLKFLLVEQNGKVCIGDCFTAALGEDLSTAFGRNAIPMIARTDSGFIGKLMQKETEFSKNFDKLPKITDAIAKNDPDTALKIYGELPDCLKNDKTFLLLRIKAAMLKGPDSKEYKDSLGAMKGAIKEGDSSLDMMLLDFYFFKKDFSKAHICIDNLNKMTGNSDPYLDSLRGNLFTAEGRLQEAETSIRKAIQREPSLESAYWNLVLAQFTGKKWGDSIKTLESIEKQFSIQMSFETMEKEADYADFIKTEEYRKWKELRLKPTTSTTAAPTQPAPIKDRTSQTPEEAFSQLLNSMLRNDGDGVRSMIFATGGMDILWQGKPPAKEMQTEIEKSYQDLKLIRIKEGEKITLPNGKTSTLKTGDISDARIYVWVEIKNERMPNPFLMVKMKNGWMIDPKPLVESRKAAAKASEQNNLKGQ